VTEECCYARLQRPRCGRSLDLDDSSACAVAPPPAPSAWRSAPTSMGSPSGVPARRSTHPVRPRLLRHLRTGRCAARPGATRARRLQQKSYHPQAEAPWAVQGPPWQGGQHAARRCSSTDTHGLEQAWQMAVAPVPCMLTQPTSAAAAAAEPSAARTRAVWAGPLGAVRALDRPSCAGRWQHRERQAVTLRGHLMQTQVCTL